MRKIKLKRRIYVFIVLLIGITILIGQYNTRQQKVKIGLFKINVSPPIGSPVAYAKTRSIQDSLFAKGIVILSDKKPIVLCAVDWIGISNASLEVWRHKLAEAVGTTTNRISIHALHQHDGVRSDFTTANILSKYGLSDLRYDTIFLHKVIESVSNAAKKAKKEALPVSHVGYGQAKVNKVASNRRILGEDGKVNIVRYSRTTDSVSIAAPEGLIDPWLKCVSFWNEEKPIVNLIYYATHPMSHYGKGDVSSDFVGIARESREKELGFSQIYFSGAGGNITAGKYNDGSSKNRYVLANRVESAMEKAWETTEKTPFKASDLQWNNAEFQFPLGKHLVESNLIEQLEDIEVDSLNKFTAASQLAWLRRSRQGKLINVSALHIKNVWLLNLPGEAFVEYQLAAQQMRPGDFICTAAYEEYGTGYVCTEIAYGQGGYESSERATKIAPESEKILLEAIENVLK